MSIMVAVLGDGCGCLSVGVIKAIGLVEKLVHPYCALVQRGEGDL